MVPCLPTPAPGRTFGRWNPCLRTSHRLYWPTVPGPESLFYREAHPFFGQDVVVAGMHTGEIFIENGRFPGETIAEAIVRRMGTKGPALDVPPCPATPCNLCVTPSGLGYIGIWDGILE